MDKITKSFFSEKEAEVFVNHFFNCWPKNIDKRWFWLAFQALEKRGLTYYESDQEEMYVRQRLVLLGVLYYEFCHVSGFHESENFNYWSPEMIQQVQKDFYPNVEEEFFEIKKALIHYFGTEDGVIEELWINCLEGSTNGILPYSRFPQAAADNSVLREEAESWFISWDGGIEEFMGISI